MGTGRAAPHFSQSAEGDLAKVEAMLKNDGSGVLVLSSCSGHHFAHLRVAGHVGSIMVELIGWPPWSYLGPVPSYPVATLWPTCAYFLIVDAILELAEVIWVHLKPFEGLAISRPSWGHPSWGLSGTTLDPPWCHLV
jgi:hypothetical protein